MYDPEQKQFILKNSLGVSYHVYFDNGRGLCIRMLGDRMIWSRGYVLSGQAVNDFFVTLDKDDIFHFIFQSIDGKILYGHGRHGQIETHPILSSKDPTPWPKHVSLLICGNTCLFFYTVRYQNRYLLSMQTLKGGDLSKPSVIDYIDGPDVRYIPVTDQSGKCHLVYTNRENSESRILYRVIKDDFSIFNAPRKIYSTERDITNLSAIWPDGGQMHILFQISDEGSYEVMYKNMSLDKPPEQLYRSKSSPGYTGLVFSGGVINFFRITGEGIYGRISRDNGKGWTEEAVFPFGNIPSLTCFRYHTNIKRERLEFCAGELPGTFSRGYQLAFFNNPVLPDINNFYPDSNSSRDSFSHSRTAAQDSNSSRDSFSHSGTAAQGSNSSRDSFSHSRTAAQDSNNSRDSFRYSGTAAQDSKAAPPAPENEKKAAAENPLLKDIQKKVLLLQNLTENMQRELTKLWFAQKEYDKKLESLSRLYTRLRDRIDSIPEYDGNNPNQEIISAESQLRDDSAEMEKNADEPAEPINCDFAD